MEKNLIEFLEKRKFLKLVKTKDNQFVPQNNLQWDLPSDFKDVIHDEHLAVLVDENLIVVDVDDKLKLGIADAVLKMVKDYNWLCHICQTDSGYHLWFKSKQIINNFTNKTIPLGFNVDFKCGNKKSMVTIKKNGVFRKWIKIVKNLDYLPKELTPFANDKIQEKYEKIPSAFNLNEGSRRDNLYKRAVVLNNSGWKLTEIINLISSINSFLFLEALPHSEILNCVQGLDSSILSPKSFKKVSNFYDDGVFLHHVFGDFLIEELCLVKFDDQLYFYNNGIYKYASDDYLASEIRSYIKFIRNNGVKEVIKYVRENKNLIIAECDKNYIALLNGLFNLQTLNLEPFDKKIFLTNKINVFFNLKSRNKNIILFFKSICCGDINLTYILLEFIGYCLLKDCRYQKALLLLGTKAANGKSTFLALLEIFFGKDNVSNVALEQLGHRFKSTGLMNKLVNIGSDIRTDFLRHVEIFKNLVVGDPIDAEFKGKNSFKFTNRAKMIFASNKLPSSIDKSEGLYRRFLIVPFENVFCCETADPNILEKITTPDALSSLFHLAILGLKRLLKNKTFTQTMQTQLALETYRDLNNNVRLFVKDTNLPNFDVDYFNNKEVKIIYEEYKFYCKSYNYKAFALNNFLEEFKNFYLPKIVRIKTIRRANTNEYAQVFLIRNIN